MKVDEIINEINRLQEKFFNLSKVVKKIKMKESFYNEIAREVQKQVSIIEILDTNKQPLNKICDIRIEIDDSIEKNYELVIDE